MPVGRLVTVALRGARHLFEKGRGLPVSRAG